MTRCSRRAAPAPPPGLTAECLGGLGPAPGGFSSPGAGPPVVREEPSMPPQPRIGRRRARPALRTSTRQPPEIVRGPGTTVHAQIEDWLAGEIAVGALVFGDPVTTE